jgi:hypothetical protein
LEAWLGERPLADRPREQLPALAEQLGPLRETLAGIEADVEAVLVGGEPVVRRGRILSLPPTSHLPGSLAVGRAALAVANRPR